MRLISYLSISTLLTAAVATTRPVRLFEPPVYPPVSTAPAPDPAKLPPISLSLHDATLEQTVDALNAALDPRSKIRATGSATGITLDAKDKPFWEIMVALGQQKVAPRARVTTLIPRPGDDVGRMTIHPGLDLTASAPATPAWPGPYAIDGPVLINVRRVKTVRNAPSPGSPPDPDFIAVDLALAIDPRIHVIGSGRPVVVKAVDNLGNHLARPRPGEKPGLGRWEANILDTGVTLNAPKTLGTTMSLTLDASVLALTRRSAATLVDVSHHLNEDVPVSTGSIRVTRFDDTPSSFAWGFTAKDLTVAPLSDAVLYPLKGGVLYTVTDSKGTTIVNTSSPTGNVSGGNAPGTPPYTLTVQVLEKAEELPVHLQISDIPLDHPAP